MIKEHVSNWLTCAVGCLLGIALGIGLVTLGLLIFPGGFK